jgi:hypothetical protein
MRGDGKSNMFHDNCFTASEFPTGRATVVLMNPPFGKTMQDKVPKFLDRALEGLNDNGRLVAIVPDSVLFDSVRLMLHCSIQYFMCASPTPLPALTFPRVFAFFAELGRLAA